MVNDNNMIQWAVEPSRKSPPPATIRRRPVVKPLLPATHSYHYEPNRGNRGELTFEDVHRMRGTQQDKCRDHITKPARKNRDKWTEEEIDQLKQLKQDGMSIPEICEVMGRSKGAIYKRLQRIGAVDKRRKWTEARLNVVRELLRQGWTDAQIAEEMGVSAGAINKTIQTYHLGRYRA